MIDPKKCSVCGIRREQCATPGHDMGDRGWVCSEKCYGSYFKPGQFPSIEVIPDPPVSKEELKAGGTRADKGKSRVDLIPADTLLEVGKIYTYGANKYEEHNWEKGMDYSRMYGSMMRHLYAFWDGQKKDPESGEHHLTCAAFGVLGLLHFELNPGEYKMFDDRVVLIDKMTPEEIINCESSAENGYRLSESDVIRVAGRIQEKIQKEEVFDVREIIRDVLYKSEKIEIMAQKTSFPIPDGFCMLAPFTTMEHGDYVWNRGQDASNWVMLTGDNDLIGKQVGNRPTPVIRRIK